jgi:hypothetical protein
MSTIRNATVSARYQCDPYTRLLDTNQRVTGFAPRGSDNHHRLTCAACGTGSYKVATSRADNGSVLLHAFCGHSAVEVMAALGLTIRELFPERIKAASHEARKASAEAFRRNAWCAALGVLVRETTLILIAANDMYSGKVLAAHDIQRVGLAAKRISQAGEVLR